LFAILPCLIADFVNLLLHLLDVYVPWKLEVIFVLKAVTVVVGDEYYFICLAFGVFGGGGAYFLKSSSWLEGGLSFEIGLAQIHGSKLLHSKFGVLCYPFGTQQQHFDNI